MSSGILYDAPRVVVPIFNSTDYNFQDNLTITPSQADARYLYRTQNDTATGRITFAGGLRMPTSRAYPPVVMTSNTAPSGYVASESSALSTSRAAYRLFNYNFPDDANNFTATGAYTAGTGLYAGAVSTTITTPPSTYLGEWAQIQLPSAIILRKFYIAPRYNTLTRAPVDFVVLGSNDGSTWEQLFSITGVSWTSEIGQYFLIASPTTAYSYYRIAVNRIGVGGLLLNFAGWVLYDSLIHNSLYYTAETDTGLLAYPSKDINFNNTMYVNSSIFSSLPVSVSDSGTTLTNNSSMGISLPAPSVMRLGTNVPISLTSLAQTTRNYSGMTTNTSNGDVYVAVRGGFIYKFVGGEGNLVVAETTPTSRTWLGMTYNPVTGNVYACVNNGDIYMQTGGVGDFIALGGTNRGWAGMTCNPQNGDVYCSVYGGDIYRQSLGVGAFNALGQTTRNWDGMAVLNGNIYACVDQGDIYMQTGGTGNFNPLGQTARGWTGMATINNDVYALTKTVSVGNGVFVRFGGQGSFVSLNQTPRVYSYITLSNNNKLFVSVSSNNVYSSPLNSPELQLVATDATASNHYAQAERFLSTGGFLTSSGFNSWTYNTNLIQFFAGTTPRLTLTDTTTTLNNQNLDMKANNLVNASQVGNSAGNLEVRVNNTAAGGTLTLTGGTGLLAATSGGSAGQHLVITINGVNYKIALQTV